jgi:hypothetical protein
LLLHVVRGMGAGIFVTSHNPKLFSDRVTEARGLYELAKGTRHEDIAWKYYEAVVALAAIACSRKRSEIRDVLRVA